MPAGIGYGTPRPRMRNLSPGARQAMDILAQGSGPEAATARRMMGRVSPSSPNQSIVQRAAASRGRRGGGVRGSINPGSSSRNLPAVRDRNLPAVRDRNLPAVRSTVTTPPSTGPGPVQDALNKIKPPKKFGRGLMIGAGAAVIAGLAYSGRRGEGSSGGRTGMTRY